MKYRFKKKFNDFKNANHSIDFSVVKKIDVRASVDRTSKIMNSFRDTMRKSVDMAVEYHRSNSRSQNRSNNRRSKALVTDSVSIV